MKLKLPKYVNEIIKKIEEYDYEAYLVGGSVRDIIMGSIPNDYDITTSAKPEDIKMIFSEYKTVLVGESFGTVLVIYDNHSIEITTFRLEYDYKDGRKPSVIKYSDKIEDDLKRRDFTINAMAYNPSIGLVDLNDGILDIERKLITTVGNPDERFNEDGLRILRCIRFASQLGFEIEDETKKSLSRNYERIKLISNDRIREELFKILLSDKPSIGIELMKEIGILDIILPDVSKMIGFDQNSPYHDKDVYYHTLAVVDDIDSNIELRLAALFHDIGKIKTYTEDEDGIGHFYNHEVKSSQMAYKIMKSLNISNKLIEKTLILIENHMYNIEDMEEKGIRRLIYKVGEENIYSLYKLNLSDKKGTFEARDISKLISRNKIIEKVLNSDNIYNKNKLEITGYDIINLGVKEGREIGNILDGLMDIVLDNPSLNNKESLIELASRKIDDTRRKKSE